MVYGASCWVLSRQRVAIYAGGGREVVSEYIASVREHVPRRGCGQAGDGIAILEAVYFRRYNIIYLATTFMLIMGVLMRYILNVQRNSRSSPITPQAALMCCFLLKLKQLPIFSNSRHVEAREDNCGIGKHGSDSNLHLHLYTDSCDGPSSYGEFTTVLVFSMT